MAMGEFHVGPNGPGPCSVDTSNPRSSGCPYGGASGEEKHFATMEEAENAYAQEMEKKGHGLFATTSRKAPKISPELKLKLQSSFDNLIADRGFGITVHPKYGYVADGSEGLNRFYEAFTDSTDNECEVDLTYEPDTDREVIRSIYVGDLDIEIENQNSDEDLRDLGEYLNDRRYEEASYWRATA